MKNIFKSVLVLFSVLALTANSFAGPPGIIVSLIPPPGVGTATMMANVHIDSMMATVIIRIKGVGQPQLEVGDAIKLERISGQKARLIHVGTSKEYDATITSMTSRGRRIEDGDIIP